MYSNLGWPNVTRTGPQGGRTQKRLRRRGGASPDEACRHIVPWSTSLFVLLSFPSPLVKPATKELESGRLNLASSMLSSFVK